MVIITRTPNYIFCKKKPSYRDGLLYLKLNVPAEYQKNFLIKRKQNKKYIITTSRRYV